MCGMRVMQDLADSQGLTIEIDLMSVAIFFISQHVCVQVLGPTEIQRESTKVIKGTSRNRNL